MDYASRIEPEPAVGQPGLSHDSARPFALSASHWSLRSLAPSVVHVALIFVVGLGLRLLFLGSKSLWLDEALSLGFAGNPPQLLWGSGYDNAHPPLYYTLLHYWLLLGDSEFVLRLSSALAGSLAVPLGYALAASLGGRRLALSTAWLIALSPLLVWYSQELRSYSLLLMLSLLAVLAFVRLLIRPHLGWWLLFIASMSASLYTHYAAVALVPVQLGLIALLSLQERTTRRGVFLWLAAWPLIFLLYWPWLTTPAMNEFIKLMGSTEPYPVELLAYYLPISPAFASTLVDLALWLAIPVALVAGYWVLRQERATWNRWAASRFVRYGLLLIFLALTLAFVMPRGYSLKKQLVHLWPFGLLLVGWVFPWRMSNRLPLALLLAASLVGSLVNVLFIPKEQWRETAAYIVEHGEPGDAIWVVPGYHALPLSYYLARADNREGEAGSDVMFDQQMFDQQPVSSSMNDSDLEARLEKGQRVWLVYHTVNVRLLDPDRRLEQWLNAHLQPVDQLHLFKIEATLYAPRP
ncbi:MAG: glycosyltransferase family 39 protein [Caldilineaceae bacterium]|nr:glycosyltransferase family 39 protein [Caldilineaceae bacterium]